ncbi:MAG: hypothetical protein IID35_04470 [Planctomycetes bacterium]|nr:hypothetical protein [Planctomycetota bacterium]
MASSGSHGHARRRYAATSAAYIKAGRCDERIVQSVAQLQASLYDVQVRWAYDPQDATRVNQWPYRRCNTGNRADGLQLRHGAVDFTDLTPLWVWADAGRANGVRGRFRPEG